MSDQAQTCAYCERPALYLCDFPLVRDGIADGRTCDRPLCEEHVHHVGRFFFDGKTRGTDTIDRCPGHVHVPDDFPRSPGPSGGRAA